MTLLQDCTTQTCSLERSAELFDGKDSHTLAAEVTSNMGGD